MCICLQAHTYASTPVTINTTPCHTAFHASIHNRKQRVHSEQFVHLTSGQLSLGECLASLLATWYATPRPSNSFLPPLPTHTHTTPHTPGCPTPYKAFCANHAMAVHPAPTPQKCRKNPHFPGRRLWGVDEKHFRGCPIPPPPTPPPQPAGLAPKTAPNPKGSDQAKISSGLSTKYAF